MNCKKNTALFVLILQSTIPPIKRIVIWRERFKIWRKFWIMIMVQVRNFFNVLLIVDTKLMRSNRPWAKFQSKSYSNRLLIDFFDLNLGVRSIVDSKSRLLRSISIEFFNFNQILIEIGRKWPFLRRFRYKSLISIKIWSFSIN